MKIELQNIAKIQSAACDINGLTVIVGDNNAGKSTMGRALFSVFHSLQDLETKIYRTKNRLVFSDTSYSWVSSCLNSNWLLDAPDVKAEMLMPYVVKAAERRRRGPIGGFRFVLPGSLEPITEERARKISQQILDRVKEVNQIGMDRIVGSIVYDEFRRVFNGQPLSLDCPESVRSVVTVEGDGASLAFEFGERMQVARFTGTLESTHDAWYVGSPLLLNAAGATISHDVLEEAHRDLISRLRRKDDTDSLMRNAALDDLEPALEIIRSHFGHRFSARSERTPLQVEVPNFREPLKVSNLSMGLKSFALIRLMIERLILRKGDILVLDEPENHLHPAWQIAYAEAIVLLRKCFNLKILLTTHSPYFLEALDLFHRGYCSDENPKTFRAYEPILDDETFRVVGLKDIGANVDGMFEKFYLAFRELDVKRNQFACNSQMPRA